MKLATWNVNSIRARLTRLLRWLDGQKPDLLCLQELKVTEGHFPFAEIEGAGYHAAVYGQKTYNGVAILSRTPLQEVEPGFGAGDDDPAARLISARVAGVRVISAYVPNGQVLGSEKWAYKLEWLRKLRAYLDRTARPQDKLVLCGDLNIAPEARDVAQPAAWEGSVLYCPEARAALEEVRAFGLVDAFRLHHSEGGLYSWWDYRMLAFPKNDGLRIDHVLVTEPLAPLCTASFIDRNERKGEQPSDHAPVVVELALGTDSLAVLLDDRASR